MSDQEYKVRDPSGAIRVIRGPAGATDEQVIAQAQRLFGSAQPAPAPAPAKPAAPQPDDAEMIAGTPAVRFALGAASPVMGLAQLADEATGGNLGISPHLRRLDDMKKRGMTPAAELKRLEEGRAILARLPGYEAQLASIDKEIAGIRAAGASADPKDAGFDLAGTAGAVMSPASLAAMKIPAAANWLGRMGQGAAVGAAFGAAAPVTEGENYWGSKGTQVGTGTVLGGVIPLAIDAGKAVVTAGRNFFDPWLPGGIDRAAGRTWNKAAGVRRDAVLERLDNPTEIVSGSRPTAGQAAAPAGSAEFSGLERAVEYSRPSEKVARATAQEAARRRVVAAIAGTEDDLAAAVANRADNAAAGYGAVRGDRIGPESNAQIMEQAIRGRAASRAGALQDQGRFATTAAQQDELAANFVPVPGLPRVSGRLSNNADRVPEARAAAADAGNVAGLRRAEKEFLESTMERLRDTVGMESRSMTELMRRPSMRSALQDAIKSAQETGAYFPRKSGEKFSVQNLQRIKESLDAGIKTAKASADAGKRPELSPQELEGTKKAFVEWLSSRSPGWKAARLQYAEDSIPINRMEVGRELEKSLTSAIGKERASTFANAVQEAPRTIKRATGQPRYEKLDDVLAPDQVKGVQNVVADLKRDAQHNELADAGVARARELLGQMAPKAPAAGMFNPKYSVARALVNRLEGLVTEKGVPRMAELMQNNPQEVARLMRATAEEMKVIEALLAQKVGRGAIVYRTMGASGQEQF